MGSELLHADGQTLRSWQPLFVMWTLLKAANEKLITINLHTKILRYSQLQHQMAKAKASLLQLTSADSRSSRRYFRVTVLSVMQCETAWCYVSHLYHPCATLTTSHVTRLNRTKQYSTTAISPETQLSLSLRTSWRRIGEMTYSFTQTAWHSMEVSVQIHAPAPLPQGNVPIE